MTKEEVEKRKLLVKEESLRLKKYDKIAKSKALVKKALINELDEVAETLDNWLGKREKESKKLRKKLDEKTKKSRKKVK